MYFLITIQFVTLVLTDYITFQCDIVIEGHQEVLDGVSSFEMDLEPHLATDIYIYIYI